MAKRLNIPRKSAAAALGHLRVLGLATLRSDGRHAHTANGLAVAAIMQVAR